jgi:Ribonuclease G/E
MNKLKIFAIVGVMGGVLLGANSASAIVPSTKLTPIIAPSSTPQTVKLTKKELIQKHQDLWKKWQEAHQKNLDEIKVARKEAQTKMEELRKKYQQDWQARQKELRDKEEVLKKKWMEENKKIQEEIKNLK